MTPQEHSESRNGLTEQEVFTVLSAARRRAALRYLEAAGGEATLPELTDHLAEQEGRDPAVPGELKPVYVSLLQNHIPALETVGVVTYDAERRLIRLTERADTVLRYLHVNGGRAQSSRLSRWFQ